MPRCVLYRVGCIAGLGDCAASVAFCRKLIPRFLCRVPGVWLVGYASFPVKFRNYVYQFFDGIHYEVCLPGEPRVLRFPNLEFLQQPAHEDDRAETCVSRAPKLIRRAVSYVKRILGSHAQGFEYMTIRANVGFCASNMA